MLGPGRLTLEPGTGRITVGPAARDHRVSRDDAATVVAAVPADDSMIGDVPIAEASAAG